MFCHYVFCDEQKWQFITGVCQDELGTVLGVSVVGLEVGFIYAYKNGWAVSAASLVQSAFLAVALIIVGAVLYREAIKANKVIGIVICLIGLYFINK